MGVLNYIEIVSKANVIKKGVEKKYTLVDSKKWAYYFAKAILNPKTNVKKINFNKEDAHIGDYFSRQVNKKEFLDMAKRLVKFVETYHKLPNYIIVANKRMVVRDYLYMFSRVLIYYNVKGKLPSSINVNSKAFKKPTESTNEVLNYFKKKTGINIKYIDDFCDWCRDKVEYEFYFDDKKSNKEVIDSKGGNCVDLTQVACNVGEGLGYEWKVVHTQCKQSGTGHVYPMFRKKGINNYEWFVRDVACISDESRYCVWCEVPNGGYKLAENPSWFLENLHR